MSLIDRTARAAALACAVLGATGAAKAQDAVFDFYISGLKAGEMTMSARNTSEGYTARSSIRAAGAVGLVANFFFDGEASGRIVGGKVSPVRYEANSKSPRAERRTVMDWKDGVPVYVSVVPPRGSAPDPATQGGTLDPVSAGLALLGDAAAGSVCDASVDVFDGSRRSRFSLGAPVAKDGAVVCAGAYSRIEGEAQSMSSQREFPFEVTFREGGDGVARLERVETRTQFGKAVLERRN